MTTKNNKNNNTVFQNIVLAATKNMRKPTQAILDKIEKDARAQVGHGITEEFINKRFVTETTKYKPSDLLRLAADAMLSEGSFGKYALRGRKRKVEDEETN